MDTGVFAAREPLQWVCGIPLVKYFAENWNQTEAFQARPDDLLICTYPKSGTTWLCEVTDMLYNYGSDEACSQNVITNRVPFLEFASVGLPTGVDQLEFMPSPRVVKTHLPVELLPKTFWEKGCKMMYLARNAKDVAVSYYYFNQMARVHPNPGTWAEFLKKFMSGAVCYGSWYDHVKDWNAKAEHHNILCLFYEDMKEDPMREIQKVQQFLGKDLEEEALEKIAQHTSFQAMKQNPMTNYRTVSARRMDHNISPFMRKGITGDWKNHFTVSQNEKFDQDYERKMAESSLNFRTVI
ncbi:sulfotransferase 1 family member D1-like [Ambystoma mexicanum]|uniref:sulfotransferase 1 family member D1-like n=1 Tax=Ambystoma mexicanum TaxID=8296 RepID=UPI0037E77103